MRILYSVLAFIGAGNIAAAVFLTLIRIEKADNTPNHIATALYFVFTMLGIYAGSQLIS